MESANAYQPESTCPFCIAGIAHREHVDAAVVRVGADFGEAS